MKNISAMKDNTTVQKDVRDALKWEPLLSGTEILVSVNDGIVTLSGTVDSYIKRSGAERAAQHVSGVKEVIEKIEVKPDSTYSIKDDNDIAVEIQNAFKWNERVPDNRIKVKVEDGWVTLEGRLNNNYQKDAAGEAVKNLMGVTGISNNIHLQSQGNDKVEKMDIESALRRDSTINDDDINVEVAGSGVILSGSVKTWYQRNEAEKIAWNAAGIETVDNELVVENDQVVTH